MVSQRSTEPTPLFVPSQFSGRGLAPSARLRMGRDTSATPSSSCRTKGV